MNKLNEKSIRELEALCSASLKDFCDGYRWMFEKDFRCSRLSAETVTVAELQKSIEGITAISNIAYAGEDVGNGAFQIILGKAALFSLGGVTVILPIPRIKEDCVKGSEEDAKMLADAVGEVGNLLTGSFSKIFRAGCPEAKGFGDQLMMRLRLPVVVGKSQRPWENEASKGHVFTYQFELNELNPFTLKVVFPTA